VRAAPATDTIDLTAEDEGAASADAELIDESSDESDETKETAESD
jgi:hypothetical protein